MYCTPCVVQLIDVLFAFRAAGPDVAGAATCMMYLSDVHMDAVLFQFELLALMWLERQHVV